MAHLVKTFLWITDMSIQNLSFKKVKYLTIVEQKVITHLVRTFLRISDIIIDPNCIFVLPVIKRNRILYKYAGR